MFNDISKPKLVVSKCLEFDYCRWNGNIIKSPIVNVLKKYVDFMPVCAESEIGLGVPRNPVRIVLADEEMRMIQFETFNDVTLTMEEFCDTYLTSLNEADGFILKSKSPSCGLFQTKHYNSMEKGANIIEKGTGLFGKKVIELYPKLAIETEGRLRNFRIREHFLIKLYTMWRFRQLSKQFSLNRLIDFHSSNKFLLMAYDQENLRNLGRIVANRKSYSKSDLIKDYENTLIDALEFAPKFTSNINVLMHMLGYFSKELSHEEKAFFLDEIEKYRTGWIPLFSCVNLLKSWIIRFDQPYLKNQTFLEPYPEELITFDLKETWRARDYFQ